MKTFKVNYVVDFCGNKSHKSMAIKADSEAEAKKMVEQEIKELIKSNPGLITEKNFYIE